MILLPTKSLGAREYFNQYQSKASFKTILFFHISTTLMPKHAIFLLLIYALMGCSPEPQISAIQQIQIPLETSIPLDKVAIDSFDIAGVGFVQLSPIPNVGYVAIDYFTDQVVIFDEDFNIKTCLNKTGRGRGEIPEFPSVIVSDSTIHIPTFSRIDCYSHEGNFLESISLRGVIDGFLPSKDQQRISLDNSGTYWYTGGPSSEKEGQISSLQLDPIYVRTGYIRTGRRDFRDHHDRNLVIAIGTDQAVTLGTLNGKAYLITPFMTVRDSTSLEVFSAYQNTVSGIRSFLIKNYGNAMNWDKVWMSVIADIGYASPYAYALTGNDGRFDEEDQMIYSRWIVLDTSTGLTPVAELTPDTRADASYSSFCITDGKLIAYNVTTSSFDIFTLPDFSKAVY